jgi:hypothetical protein
MMRCFKWISSVSLCALLAGCEPTQWEPPEAPDSEARAQAERLAEARGFDPREVTMMEEPGGEGPRFRPHLRGVPILGLASKTAHGQTHFPLVRIEPGARAETKPRLTWQQAVEAVLARLEDPSARVTGARLMLLPREERRLRADAPALGATPPNAAHFERVVTGFTLIYRLELSTGDTRPGRDQPWLAQVDAHSGQVLKLAPLQLDNEVRNVTGHGHYVGTRGLRILYNTEDALYELADTYGNTYESTVTDALGNMLFELYTSEDTTFGDGQLYTPANGPDSANGETAAVDAYYAVQWTWSFFRGALGRTGPTGTGRPVVVKLHYPLSSAGFVPRSSGNAELRVGYRPLPDAQMRRIPMATTDIIAHELGHDFFGTAVWANPATDTDPGPSELAALNEATGDIVGFLTELSRFARGGASGMDSVTPTQAHFNLGEETGTVSRNIYAPVEWEWFPEIGQRDPHDAAGPIERMFVLLSYGCVPMPATEPPTEKHCPRIPEGFAGIRPLRATRIWARTVEHLPDGADFLQARELALDAARVEDGPYSGANMRAVALAFAAVNIGGRPDTVAPTVSMTCQQVRANIECTGTITDADTPGRYVTAPRIVVDGGAATYTLPGWQFTTTVPGASLAEGSHTLQLQAWDWWNNEATQTVTVALDKTAPVASLTRSGPPKLPTLFVDASDPAGISRVEFLDGTTPLTTVSTAPYRYEFDTSTWTDGTHGLVIKVYDRFDNVTVLHHALLVDNTRPVVTMTVGSGEPPFNVSATATDASALVRADFKVDGIVFATRTTGSPYQAVYTPSDPLAHNLYVEVTDSFGNVGVAVQAAPLDKTPPTVTFSAQQTYTQEVRITVNVADTCGIQYPFGLYVDGSLVAQVMTPGYLLVLGSSLSVGVHTFHAPVTDGCGNSNAFQAVFSKVYTPPAISAVIRDDTQPKKPKFTVQCNDTEGVHHVEMRENGVVVQSDSTAPYEFVVDTTTRADGSYTVLFQCMDIYGASSSPETRTVTADNTGPTVQSFTVYGAGRSYQVSASVSDLRGIKSVNLRGGLALPAFSVTLTQAPYFHNFVFSAYIIKDYFPFWVTATDNWGNVTNRAYRCYMDTSTTQNAYLSCLTL